MYIRGRAVKRAPRSRFLHADRPDLHVHPKPFLPPFLRPFMSDPVEGDYSLEYRILDQVHLIPKAELLLDIVLVALDCLDADA